MESNIIFVGPGPVNCLTVTRENSTSFKIIWKSPSPSNKNGIISHYYVVATFNSNDSFVKDVKLNVIKAVDESTDYSISLTGLGEVLYTSCSLPCFLNLLATFGSIEMPVLIILSDFLFVLLQLKYTASS